MQNVTAVILAGGFGMRLRPAVAGRPKTLAEVRGRPFLAYLFDQLSAVCVRDVVVCTGYLGAQIQVTFGKRYGPLRLTYSQELSPLDTAGALRLAVPLVHSDLLLVMNGDSYCDADLRSFWCQHCAHGARGSLLLIESLNRARYGQVQVDARGYVCSFHEKQSGDGPGWINSGIYLFDRHLVLEIPPNKPVSLEREMFPAWISYGLCGYRSRARFLDIGTPESFAMATSFFAEIDINNASTRDISHPGRKRGKSRDRLN
jgi:NDP-sugar pyrophosphorylase family protein